MFLSSLEQSVLKTIVYFDIFDYPLTLVEVSKWLYEPDGAYQLFDLTQALQNLTARHLISSQDGFYFLFGRQAIIATRLERYLCAEKKFRIACKTSAWLRLLPTVEMVAVCNNAGYGNSDTASDIDFFIVSAAHRLWWTRLSVMVLVSFLRVRRHGRRIKDRVCLSFYTTPQHLNLATVARQASDPYLVYWLSTLWPLYGFAWYEKLIEHNKWRSAYLPRWYAVIPNLRRQIVDGWLVSAWRWLSRAVIGSRLGDVLERLAKGVQQQRLRRYLGAGWADQAPNVVVSDAMLKLHKIDRRAHYDQLWRARRNELGV